MYKPKKIKGLFKNRILAVGKLWFIIYLIVNVVYSASVWVPYLLAILGWKQGWTIGSVIWGIWLGPVPFIPICVITTQGIYFIIKKIRQ